VGLSSHLESFLGNIEAGWRRGADGVELPFQVARFQRGVGDGTVAFATLGLSDHLLDGRTKQIRQEFVMIGPESLRDGPVPGIMQQVGTGVLEAHSALLRGDVLGPKGSLFVGSKMEAIYVSLPVYFPDEFSVYTQNEIDIAMAWLVPISRNEAHYVRECGWRDFEERLTEIDPDLVNVYREPLTFPRKRLALQRQFVNV
jgi:hypothetical protein